MRWGALLFWAWGVLTLAQVPPEQPVLVANALFAAYPGSELLVALVVEIPEGLAIQPPKPTLPYLIPTQVSFEVPKDLFLGEVLYPEPVLKKVAFAKKAIAVYTGSVVFLLPVQVASDAQPGLKVLRGKISYQACTQTYCFLPTEQEVSLALLVVPPKEKRVSEEGKEEKALQKLFAMGDEILLFGSHLR